MQILAPKKGERLLFLSCKNSGDLAAYYTLMDLVAELHDARNDKCIRKRPAIIERPDQFPLRSSVLEFQRMLQETPFVEELSSLFLIYHQNLRKGNRCPLSQMC